LFVTSMRRAGRAIPKVCAKTFPNGIVLLELLQAVTDLGSFIAPVLDSTLWVNAPAHVRTVCFPSRPRIRRTEPLWPGQWEERAGGFFAALIRTGPLS
jgi:hypothetical protein